jgi:hypothetical protein
MNIITRCFNPTPLFCVIRTRIPHKVFIIPGRVKVGHAAILIVLIGLTLPRPPRIDINPDLFLLTLLLLLIMVMRNYSMRDSGGFCVLSFKSARHWNHDDAKASTHHD